MNNTVQGNVRLDLYAKFMHIGKVSVPHAKNCLMNFPDIIGDVLHQHLLLEFGFD
jgi:hypothetical protein